MGDNGVSGCRSGIQIFSPDINLLTRQFVFSVQMYKEEMAWIKHLILFAPFWAYLLFYRTLICLDAGCIITI